MKKILHNILFMGLTFLIFIILIEICIRLVFPQQETMRWFQSSERYGFEMKRNFHQQYHYIGSDFIMDVKTNSLGLRNDELDLESRDKKNILLLGDSYTFGYAVNTKDNFATKLENLLNNQENKWQVINSGHGGWGTLQESLYAQDHFSLFKPDVLILTFCGNDPADDVLFLNKRHDSEKGIFYFPGKIFIRDNSHLYRFIFYHYKKILHNWAIKKKLANISNNKDIYIDTWSGSVIIDKDWKRTQKYINELHSSFTNFNPNGITLIQASAPLNENIYKNLKEISNDSNLIYVDLSDEVQKLKPEERILSFDGHWSPKMHSISAQNLFLAIQELKIE